MVITAILLMGYAANQCVMRFGAIPTRPAFALLFVALLAGWGFSYLSLGGTAIPMAWLVMPAVLTAPLFFAGLIFSGELSRGGDIGPALSANIFGAMLGGFLEYNSMYGGYTMLYPLGIALYGLAFVCHLRAGRASAAPTSANDPAHAKAA